MRLKTNFPLLDKMLGGGFSQQSLVVVNDTSATSGWMLLSTILSQELEKEKYAIIMAFDHSPNLMRKQLKTSGIDVKKLEEEHKLFFVNCFKFAEKIGPLTVTNPSSSPEVMRPFREVNRITKGKMKNKTVCVVDSLLSLTTLFSIRDAVSFGLLMREITVKYGCVAFLLIPDSVDEKCTKMIEYNTDIVLEFKIKEHEGKKRPMLRINRRFSSLPSDWIPYVAKNGSIRKIG